MENNASQIHDGFDILSTAISQRLFNHFNRKGEAETPILPPDTLYPVFKNLPQLNKEETLIVFIALAPHILPNFFDAAIQNYLPQGGEFPEFGGVKMGNHRGMQPTGETVLFILAGVEIEQRLRVSQYFSAEHLFHQKNILWIEAVANGEPTMSGKLSISQEYVDLLTIGRVAKPQFNTSFPAKNIETGQSWNDLVLSEDALLQLQEIQNWLHNNHKLMTSWKMNKKLKPGYRVLFHGPPGTGKTLTASLLGKQTKREVYRVDLSTVVSKYIGETEKNLEALFKRAEAKNWILFFDEADALFGKRTGVRDAHDKYANQEVSYLLQRMEDFDGLIILASNLKTNIDEAFIRRFNAIVKFALPTETEREEIWRKSFPEKIKFFNNVDIPAEVKKYEFSGGNIINIVQYACLKALEKKANEIFIDDVLEGIKREMHKEGRPFQ